MALLPCASSTSRHVTLCTHHAAHNHFCSLFVCTLYMPDTGSVIILSIHVQCRGMALNRSLVVELFVALVRDLAVLVSSPGPQSATHVGLA